MFEKKRITPFKVPVKSKGTPKAATGNAFTKAGMSKAAETRSGNGALKFSETDNPFVTQFGKLGEYKVERSYADIARDQSILWAENPLLSVCFIIYLRIITRKVRFPDGTRTEGVARGAGLKHESIVRMIWLHINHPDTFWKNILLFISVGSWKDVIQMLTYDLTHGKEGVDPWETRQLDWDKLGDLIVHGLSTPGTAELVKKYLPQLRAESQGRTAEREAHTNIAKWIAYRMGFSSKNHKAYRKLKTSGTAHTWQQHISRREYSRLDFGAIHGRALALLAGGKFLKNQGLEAAYQQWVETQPIVKYTGWPHELFLKGVNGLTKYQEMTLNKQFTGLVETARKGANPNTGMIVVRDTSASMGSPPPGIAMSCYNIAKALALFFSYMLPEGHFAGNWIEFNSTAKMHAWMGSTPVERWRNDRSSIVGSTNFQSVIQLFVQIRQKGVPESEFPTGILCISDSEFNPTQLDETNVVAAKRALLQGRFSSEYVRNFKIVLWNLQNTYYGPGSGSKFETHDTKMPNVYYFSGYDASVVAFLTGTTKSEHTPQNAEELLQAALTQEVMHFVSI